MKKNEHKYKFTAMPVNLTACMDNNCRSMLFTLLQLSSYFENRSKSENKKWNGWFFRSNADLQAESRLSENLVRATISTFYRIGIVDVKLDGKSKNQTPNKFRLNEAAMLQWEKYSLEDCIKNPDYAIKTDQHKATGWKPSYLVKASETIPQSQPLLPQSEDNIDNAANVENTENADNTEKKEENIDTYHGTLGATDLKQSQDAAFDRYYREEDMYMRILNSYPHNWRAWEDILIALDVLMEKAPSPDLAKQTYWKIRCFLNERVTILKERYAEDPYCDDAIDFENKLEEWASYSKRQSGAFSYFGDE